MPEAGTALDTSVPCSGQIPASPRWCSIWWWPRLCLIAGLTLLGLVAASPCSVQYQPLLLPSGVPRPGTRDSATQGAFTLWCVPLPQLHRSTVQPAKGMCDVQQGWPRWAATTVPRARWCVKHAACNGDIPDGLPSPCNLQPAA